MRRGFRAAAIAVASLSTLALTASPAFAADANFTWGSGAYHASGDFVPSSDTLYIGGSAGPGGSARYFYTQLMKTNGKEKVFSTYSYPADGHHYKDPRSVHVSTNTSYYLRWHGQKQVLNNGEDNGDSAPSASAFTSATPPSA